MKHILMIGAMVAAFALPAAAEEDDAQTLMEQGAELFFEGLRREMEPALDELLGLADQFGPAMRSFMQEMGPALAELAAEVKDWSVYEMPEILPNGDIIIRKKQTEDAPDKPEVLPEDPDGATDI